MNICQAVRYILLLTYAIAFTSAAYVPSAGCVVSRAPNFLDVFAVGSDGHVYTAAWQPGDTGFRGWWPVAKSPLAPLSPHLPVS